MTTYERNHFLYGYDELEGKPATMLFLPTARSRKWRTGWSVGSFSEHAYQQALRGVQAGDFHAFRFCEGYH